MPERPATADETPVDDAPRALAAAVIAWLSEHGNPERAAGQRHYMKSALPFYGVAMPDLRAGVGRIVAEKRFRLEPAEWRRGVLTLWDAATHREERYAALVLARHRLYAAQARRVSSLDLFEHLVRTGAWWDLCDEVAHLVGGVLLSHRDEVTPIMRDWARDRDLWVRRVAILSQLDHRELTDTDLLHDCIEPNLGDPEFFIRKAIGWALRQYGRVDAEWVRSVVTLLDDRLSPLSRREALKHL